MVVSYLAQRPFELLKELPHEALQPGLEVIVLNRAALELLCERVLGLLYVVDLLADLDEPLRQGPSLAPDQLPLQAREVHLPLVDVAEVLLQHRVLPDEIAEILGHFGNPQQVDVHVGGVGVHAVPFLRGVVEVVHVRGPVRLHRHGPRAQAGHHAGFLLDSHHGVRIAFHELEVRQCAVRLRLRSARGKAGLRLHVPISEPGHGPGHLRRLHSAGLAHGREIVHHWSSDGTPHEGTLVKLEA
mmetsp:Transcript_47064/g.131236  ORF Transcript_47064/g.131236 Transcript_47064/m.131236 type:complete len:243 (+) Transcript_47064:1290-2018(+)